MMSRAISLTILFHGSDVFRSNISTNGPTGFNRMLFHVPCRQLASLV